jgi:hypothetical protein
MADSWLQISFQLLQSLTALLNADVISLLSRVPLPRFLQRPGSYEVLEHKVRLELCDPQGHKAIYYKDQKVRFLQNNVIAYQDVAWGVGDIFADYQCSPGVVVDRYREGHRYQVLISLRQSKNWGDRESFHIERTILDGFTHADEDFQMDIDHRMYFFSFSVIFPVERPPKVIRVIEQNSTRSTVLDHQYRQILADGRVQVTWTTKHPHLYESYILAWNW